MNKFFIVGLIVALALLCYMKKSSYKADGTPDEIDGEMHVYYDAKFNNNKDKDTDMSISESNCRETCREKSDCQAAVWKASPNQKLGTCRYKENWSEDISGVSSGKYVRRLYLKTSAGSTVLPEEYKGEPIDMTVLVPEDDVEDPMNIGASVLDKHGIRISVEGNTLSVSDDGGGEVVTLDRLYELEGRLSRGGLTIQLPETVLQHFPSEEIQDETAMYQFFIKSAYDYDELKRRLQGTTVFPVTFMRPDGRNSIGLINMLNWAMNKPDSYPTIAVLVDSGAIGTLDEGDEPVTIDAVDTVKDNIFSIMISLESGIDDIYFEPDIGKVIAEIDNQVRKYLRRGRDVREKRSSLVFTDLVDEQSSDGDKKLFTELYEDIRELGVGDALFTPIAATEAAPGAAPASD